MTELNVQCVPIRLVRLPEVIGITGLRRSSIYARIQAGRFPTAIPLGGHAVGWIEAEIIQWVNERVAEARPIPTRQHLAQAA
jgi:prophage regulatory protein